MRTAEKDLRVQVAAAYLQALYNKGEVTIAHERLQVSQLLLERARSLFGRGKRPESDTVEAAAIVSRETRKIRDDFNCDLMGAEYPEQDWQADIAFMLQCVRLYLSLPIAGRKVMPPMECVEHRSERAAIGKDFEDWAEVYFAPDSGNLDREIKQDEIFNNFCREVTYKISKNKLTMKLRIYCEYASHIHCLNPASVTGKTKDGERIMRRADGVMACYYYVQSVEDFNRQQQEIRNQSSQEQELPF